MYFTFLSAVHDKPGSRKKFVVQRNQAKDILLQFYPLFSHNILEDRLISIAGAQNSIIIECCKVPRIAKSINNRMDPNAVVLFSKCVSCSYLFDEIEGKMNTAWIVRIKYKQDYMGSSVKLHFDNYNRIL